MRKSIAANEKQLESIRRFSAKTLACAAGVHERTALKAKAGERVHPLMLQAIVTAANTLAERPSAA